jgi:serine/threonine-protein kinase
MEIPTSAHPPPASPPRVPLADELKAVAARKLVLGDTIGAGGLGEVKRAWQPAIEREVAVKYLRYASWSEVAVADLLREARVTGSLEHPNVVPIHGIGFDDERGPLVIMKLIQGAHWGNRLAKRQFPLDADALVPDLRILSQLCQVVHFAHSRGVLHRDLKPANVMVGEFGEVYLVDWGLATTASDAETTNNRSICGTPAYMAPEMVTGRRATLGPWTDVYLLGATLHELLTGRPRHGGAKLSEVLAKAAASPPASFGPEVPRELAAICNRACHADPAERFESALAMKQALDEYVERRNAYRLLAMTEERALTLLAALDSAAPQDPESASRIQVSFHETLFGFEQVLAIAPDLDQAVSRRRECLERMLEHHLQNRDPRGARGVLALLARPTDGQRAAVESLEAEARAQRERVARLEHDADRRVSARQRTILMIAIAVIGVGWNALAIVTAFGPHAHLEAGPFRLLVVALVLWVVVVTGALVWRRRFWGNEMNRRFIWILVLLFTGLLINRACAYFGGSEIQPVLIADMILFGFAVLLLRPLLRWAWVLGALCWLGAVAIAAIPSPVGQGLVLGVVTSIVATAVALEWVFRLHKPRPPAC